MDRREREAKSQPRQVGGDGVRLVDDRDSEPFDDDKTKHMDAVTTDDGSSLLSLCMDIWFALCLSSMACEKSFWRLLEDMI